MSDYYREHSLWVFLSVISTIHAFMHVFINVSSETYATRSEIAIQEYYNITLKSTRYAPTYATWLNRSVTTWS